MNSQIFSAAFFARIPNRGLEGHDFSYAPVIFRARWSPALHRKLRPTPNRGLRLKFANNGAAATLGGYECLLDLGEHWSRVCAARKIAHLEILKTGTIRKQAQASARTPERHQRTLACSSCEPAASHVCNGCSVVACKHRNAAASATHRGSGPAAVRAWPETRCCARNLEANIVCYALTHGQAQPRNAGAAARAEAAASSTSSRAPPPKPRRCAPATPTPRHAQHARQPSYALTSEQAQPRNAGAAARAEATASSTWSREPMPKPRRCAPATPALRADPASCAT